MRVKQPPSELESSLGGIPRACEEGGDGMKPSEMTALHVLTALAWKGARQDPSDRALSDGVLAFDVRAIRSGTGPLFEPGLRCAPGVADRAFTIAIESRTGPVDELWIDEDRGYVQWSDGTVDGQRFALAQLACPAEEFAAFDLRDDQGRYGLLGLRGGVVVWVLMGIVKVAA